MSSFLSTLTRDLGARSLPGVLAQVATVRGVATLLLRIEQAVGAKLPPVASVNKQFNHLLTGADIAWQASIGPGLTLFHPTGVVIGPFVTIGDDAQIQQGVTLGGPGFDIAKGEYAPSPVLGNRVRLGAGAKITGPLTLGDDVTVGTNSVVTKNVADHTTVVGVPARPVESRKPEDDDAPGKAGH
ncbi:MAG: serine O-acetyltransferase [Corynebacterium variabile]|uniref:serine O-acetyltransferase n=1 Tax=Corynebacterium variabile TaxID=1727 RepID=UPI003FB8035B